MKKYYKLLFFTFTVLLTTVQSFAQFNPRNNTVALEAKVDTLKVSSYKTSEMLNFKIYNDAYDKYLRELQSKQRNFFKMKTGLQLNQTSFTNWAAGGNNSFSGRLYLNMEHSYKSPKFEVKTVFDAAYGMLSTDAIVRKSEDYFNISSSPSLRMSPRWELSASLILNSQFTNSYKAPGDTIKTSSLFAPAYVTVAPGFKYNNLKKTVELFMAPGSLNMIMVLDRELADKGVFGEAGRQYIPKFINYFRFEYKEKIIKEKLTFHLKFETFWDYNIMPRIVSENKIDFKISRLFSANIYIKGIYDDQIQTPDVKDGGNDYFQMTETFGFGIGYNFETKKHPAPPETPRKKIKRIK